VKLSTLGHHSQHHNYFLQIHLEAVHKANSKEVLHHLKTLIPFWALKRMRT
jgi:hypothetical protein